MKNKNVCKCSSGMIVSEAAFFAALYYLLNILQIQGNLWTHSLVLFVLINISVLACPIMNPKVCK